MDAYTLNLVFLFVALLCQVLISGTSVECWLRRDLPRPQRFTWLALSLAGLLFALHNGYALELAVRTGLNDFRQATLSIASPACSPPLPCIASGDWRSRAEGTGPRESQRHFTAKARRREGAQREAFHSGRHRTAHHQGIEATQPVCLSLPTSAPSRLCGERFFSDPADPDRTSLGHQPVQPLIVAFRPDAWQAVDLEGLLPPPAGVASARPVCGRSRRRRSPADSLHRRSR